MESGENGVPGISGDVFHLKAVRRQVWDDAITPHLRLEENNVLETLYVRQVKSNVLYMVFLLLFSAGYLNVYIELFLFELDCVTDRYPKGLSQNCRRQFSCDVLKRLNRCNKQYKNAMSLGCKTQITNWWKNQWVKNNCKKACLNCAPRKWAMLCYRSYISF